VSEKSAVCGIDPGLDGGICILRDDAPPELHIMPTLETGQGSKRTLDAGRIMQILLDANPRVVIVERQQAYPKQGGVSNFTTGLNFGTLLGLLCGLEMAHQVVTPREWGKALGVSGKTKNDGCGAVLVAQRMFPGVNLLATARCRVAHDGLADALLIAEYGRRTV
jgi:crossover junction endodeoxyribonuclease RuvC